jgi:hypothetical protein
MKTCPHCGVLMANKQEICLNGHLYIRKSEIDMPDCLKELFSGNFERLKKDKK